MAYTNQTELESAYSSQTILQLVDDEGAGSFDATNQARITKAIELAGKLIDSYCQAHFSVPFSPTPAMIGELAVTLSAWYLYRRRRQAFGVPEDIKEDHAMAIRQLERINEGKLDLGLEPSPSPSDKSLVSYDGPDQLFTSDYLEDM